MNRRVENWSIKKLDEERTRISFPEYQREKSLWATEKKCLLIDSILQDIDIPKLYFNIFEDGNIEVIDGQQRLWSVWEFLDDDFPCKVNGKTQRFSELDEDEKERLRGYQLQVTEFDEADDDYLRMLFIRLQLGLLLNTGEKLHAATGQMHQLVFGDLAKHPFIQHIGIPKRRYSKETLGAQICINSFRRAEVNSFARTRYDDLESFFSKYADPRGKDLERFIETSKSIFQVMDQLWTCFGEKSVDLKNRSYILSIYLFVEELIRSIGTLSEQEQVTFSDFVFLLWTRLREESAMGIDRENRELYSFQTLLSSAPGEEYQIARRHKKLSEYYDHFKETGKIKDDK